MTKRGMMTWLMNVESEHRSTTGSLGAGSGAVVSLNQVSTTAGQ